MHKENAAKGAHPNHLEFHKECLNATYRATANDDSLLGFNAGDPSCPFFLHTS